MGAFVAITVVAVLVLLVAEKRRSATLRWIAKPIAALGFVGAAIANGAPESEYGRAVLLALVLSLAGDIFLIPKSKKIFKLGVFAFLLAHLAYLVAFVRHGVTSHYVAFAFLVLVPIAFVIGRGLLPRIPAELKGPVLAYIAVISSMVAFAVATKNQTIIVAAILFYVSDLCVAREKFLTSDLWNKMIGLPLYFGAQLVFAATI